MTRSNRPFRQGQHVLTLAGDSRWDAPAVILRRRGGDHMGYWPVRFADGARLCVHESQILPADYRLIEGEAVDLRVEETAPPFSGCAAIAYFRLPGMTAHLARAASWDGTVTVYGDALRRLAPRAHDAVHARPFPSVAAAKTAIEAAIAAA